jgi:hypothetical protein
MSMSLDGLPGFFTRAALSYMVRPALSYMVRPDQDNLSSSALFQHEPQLYSVSRNSRNNLKYGDSHL